MIAGQMKDIASETKLLTMEELEELHALKTGALIEASIYSGAELGGGRQAQIDLLGIYAKNIGLAFQIKDDLFDYGYQRIGKTTGIDIKDVNDNMFWAFGKRILAAWNAATSGIIATPE